MGAQARLGLQPPTSPTSLSKWLTPPRSQRTMRRSPMTAATTTPAPPPRAAMPSSAPHYLSVTKPALHVLSALPAFSLCRFPLRSLCTALHNITCPPNDVGGHDVFRPPATLCAQVTTHANERDPHFCPRRPYSQLRGARSKQDDQPAALQAAPSHAGAHDGYRTLPYSRVHKNCASSPQ